MRAEACSTPRHRDVGYLLHTRLPLLVLQYMTGSPEHVNERVNGWVGRWVECGGVGGFCGVLVCVCGWLGPCVGVGVRGGGGSL